jgi:PAS domain S-box-containing protein
MADALQRIEWLDRPLTLAGRSVHLRIRPDVLPDHHLLVLGRGAAESVDRLVRAHQDAAWAARFHRVTSSFAGAVTIADVAREATRLGRELLRADAAALALLTPDGAELESVTAAGLDDVPGVRFALGRPTPWAEALRSGAPVVIEDPRDLARYGDAPRAFPWPPGTRAVVPLVLADRPIGALAIGLVAWRRLAPVERRFLELLAAHCARAVERSRLLEAEQAALRRLRFLAEAAEALREPDLRLPDLLERVTRHLADTTGDVVLLRLVSDDGLWLDAAASYHPDAAAREDLARTLAGHRLPFEPVRQAIEATAGETLFLPTASPEEVARLLSGPMRAWLEAHPVYGLVSVPLAVKDRIIGILSTARPGPDAPYSADDRQLVEGLGEVAAATIDNARLRAANERARAEAERAAERAARLQQVTAALAGTVTVDEVCAVAVRHGIAALGGVRATVHLLSPDGERLDRVAHHGQPAETVRPYVSVTPDRKLPLAEAVRTGAPVFLEDAPSMQSRYPETAGSDDHRGVGALAAVPLHGSAGVLGSLVVRFAEARTFAPEEREMLAAIGSQCAQALERARLLAGLERELGERRRAEAELARSNRLFESIAEASPDMLYLHDLQLDRCVYVNHAVERILGLAPGDVPGPGGLAARIHPEDLARLQTEAGTLAPPADEAFRDLELRVRHVDGTWRWLLGRGRILSRTASGAPHLFLGFAQDITGRRQAEAERAELLARERAARRAAEAASRAKDEFLAMLGHELRNPLAPLVTALELMRLQGGEAFRPERTVIERQVAHLGRLVDDLLDVSRIVRGKVELRRHPVDLVGVVAKAVEMASPLLERQAHHLTCRVSPAPLVVDGDEQRLAQVFANLLTNAAKYTEPGGAVTVTAEAEGDAAVVRVRDTGIGMAPELLPRVFDLFVQGERSLDRSGGGLGLGLAIAQRLVALHGGAISAHSEGLGKGSELVVRVPLLVGLAAESIPPAASPMPDPGGLRVLVVDDNVDAAEMLARMLRRRGYAVETAHDGPEALAAAPRFAPDVALVDIGLPVMDGYELAGALRARATAPVLVAVTGYGQASDRERSAQAGFAAHLVKPVHVDELCRVIDAVAPARVDRPV